MGNTTDLRRAIKEAFVPLMQRKGFSIDRRDLPHFLTFRRIATERVDVCDIQWDKYGRSRFALNFGSCSALGANCHGKEIKAADVTPSSAPRWGRLIPGPSRTTSGWFRQDRGLVRRIWAGARLKPAEEVVAELTAIFPEVEDYWQRGIVGKHISVMTRSWSSDIADG